MILAPFHDRLAICSWSLQPRDPAQLLSAIREIGLSRVQIALDPLRDQPAVWGEFGSLARQANVTLVSGMFGTVGEDYSTLESIRRTGGLVPDDTWDENWENIEADAALAHELGLRLVTFHAGFIPHDEADPEFEKLQHRIRLVADVFGARGMDLAFETGQETAATLRSFLEKLGRPNVGVNFDPANVILYDTDEPLAALQVLGPWIKQCHLKDARRTRHPGTWGEEVVVGNGEVDWERFFRELRAIQFSGWCCIEREAGTQRIGDITAARRKVESLGV